MDFLVRMKEYIESNISLNGPVAPGVLSADNSSVALRETPGSLQTRYADNDRVFEIGFQLLVKDPDHTVAYDSVHALNTKLDGLPGGTIQSSDGSFEFITCRTNTTPNFVEKNDQGAFIYTVMFTAELEKGGV